MNARGETLMDTTPPAAPLTKSGAGRRSRLVRAIAWCAAAVLLLWLTVHHLRSDPRIIWLASDHEAKWIRPDRPFDPGAKFDLEMTASFATRFTTNADQVRAQLEVTALR